MKKIILAALSMVAGIASADPTREVRARTDKAEDAAHAGGDYGSMCLAVRKDTAAALAGTDGDYIPLTTNSTGALYVTTTGGAPAPGYIEDAAETAAAVLSMCGTVRRDTAASSAGTTGDNATLNTDATGNLWVVSAVLEDAAETAANPLLGVGAVRRDTAASSAGTTGDNATLNTDATGHLWVMPNILTVAGSTAVVEDAAETAAGNLVPIATVRRDTAASSAGTTGDNATLNTDSTGQLWVNAGTVAQSTGAAAITCGQQDVAATGTAVQLGSNACKVVILSCEAGNTSACYVTHAAGNGVTGGMELAKSTQREFRVANTNLLWVDAGTNGDDVGWCCIN